MQIIVITINVDVDQSQMYYKFSFIFYQYFQMLCQSKGEKLYYLIYDELGDYFEIIDYFYISEFNHNINNTFKRSKKEIKRNNQFI